MKLSITIILCSILLFWALANWRGSDGADTDGTEIEFWTYAASGSPKLTAEFWAEVKTRFEKENPGARVRLVTDVNQGNYLQVLSARVIAGRAPDVMIVDDGNLPFLNMEHVLMPLDHHIESDPDYTSADFAAGMVADSYVGDQRFSIPWYGGFPCLFYRRDLLAQYNLLPPGTLDELIAVSRVLQEKAGIEYPFAMMPVTGMGAFLTMPMVWQNGGRILSPDLREVQLDQPGAVAAVRQVHDLFHKHRICDPALTKGGEAVALWGQGQAAMLLDGVWILRTMDQDYPGLRGNWDVRPMPLMGPAKTFFHGGQHLVMTRYCQHSELAWKFMAVATGADMQKRWADILGAPPANLKTFELPEFQRDQPQLYELRTALTGTRNNPFAPFFQELWYSRFVNAVLDVVMPNAEADVAAVIGVAMPSLQRLADEYWRSNPYFQQGRQQPERLAEQ